MTMTQYGIITMKKNSVKERTDGHQGHVCYADALWNKYGLVLRTTLYIRLLWDYC